MYSPTTIAAQGVHHRSHALAELHIRLSLGNDELTGRHANEVGGRGPTGPSAGPAVAERVELERAGIDIKGDGAAVASTGVA